VAGEPILRLEDVSVSFPTEDGDLKAVDGVSYEIHQHEVLGIVGESGSGKSVTSMAILGLLPSTARVSGHIWFEGRDLLALSEGALRRLRGGRIAMVFQDALASLNPVFTVGSQIAEAIVAHGPATRHDAHAQAVGLLELVGISGAKERVDQYPHEFSGGMRQRAMIAMAIANDPVVLIADEPTTALDVTIQAQVLDVLERIQERTSSSIVLITHDLGVVAGVADRVLVMYAGRRVEEGSVEEIFYESRHPYTRGLLASLPRLDRGGANSRLYGIRGQPPSLLNPPSGCGFHPRCDHAHLPAPCSTETPVVRQVGPGHFSACHFAETIGSGETGDR